LAPRTTEMEPTTPKPHFNAAQVREYYERHTRAFLRFGQGAQLGTIRRAVWGPGVSSREQAFHYVDDRLVEIIGRTSGPTGATAHVVDLGCGMGASLCHIAAHLPIRGTGITLSPVQAELANRRIQSAGLADRVLCVVGDYCAPPDSLPPADAAYAIEAFVHSPDAPAFFDSAARLVRPGGLLVICDDFLRETRTPDAATTVAEFRRGWRLNSLVTTSQACAAAGEAGFVHKSTTALTPALDLRRPRDYGLALLAPMLGLVPQAWLRFGHVLGGNALRQCLRAGWVGYDLLVFRRTG
jgi:SAM-dependent methyltransferase